ncbi:SCO family protein, partial [Bacteroidota bacterium]
IPLELEFFTSEKDTIKLEELVNVPVLLALVYYECPGICSPLLSELGWVSNRVDLQAGSDFRVIAISFDHNETPDISKKWKKNYLQSLNNEFPEEYWTFLTGDSSNIQKLTKSVGFHFKPDREQFVHAGCVISISPKGKICRYLFGTKFNPFDVKMALLEAQSGKTNPTISKVLQFCFSYDPEGRKYTLNVTRIMGTIMLLGIGILLIVLLKKKRK